MATGTPVVTDPADLASCFQMITKNPNLLESKYFHELFISKKD